MSEGANGHDSAPCHWLRADASFCPARLLSQALSTAEFRVESLRHLKTAAGNQLTNEESEAAADADEAS